MPNPLGVTIADGTVLASARQTDGKVVIGGTFKAIDGLARNNIARLNVDGSVDASWNPGADDMVEALSVSGNTVYVGGRFFNLGGEPRKQLGAVAVTSGLATPWDPGAANTNTVDVRAIALNESAATVYVAGSFSHMGGAARNNIAALSAVDGGALAQWNPGAGGQVYSMLVVGNTLYVAGNLLRIGAQSPPNLAAVDATTGAVLPWSPMVNDAVTGIEISGATLYLSGRFSMAGGQLRYGLAAIDTGSGMATSWAPTLPAGYAVFALRLAGDTIYVGGTTSNSEPQLAPGFLARIGPDGNTSTTWNPGFDLAINSIAVSGNTVFAGGNFTAASGITTGGLAEIDAASAAVTPHQLSNSAGNVTLLQSQPDGKVIVAGAFSAIGSVVRNHLARLNGDGTLDLSWNPGVNVDGDIKALCLGDGVVYVGGSFQSIGGAVRPRLAAIDLASGLATAWAPDIDDVVSAVAASGSTVYVGGNFQHISGVLQPWLAALDASSAQALPWSAQPDQAVTSLALGGTSLYAAGYFRNVAAAPRQGLAAFDANGGALLPWNPAPDGSVTAMLPVADTLYIAGTFSNIAGSIRHALANFDVPTGALGNWQPGDGILTASTLAWVGDGVAVGGVFSQLGNQSRNSIAVVDPVDGIATPWLLPLYPASSLITGDATEPHIGAVAFNGRYLFMGGYFDQIAGMPRGSLAAATYGDLVFSNGFE